MEKITEISNTMFEVNGYNVKFQIKKGRTILLCSCSNSSRFADNNFCSHKQAVLKYLNLREINKQIDKLIEFYTGQKNINFKIEPEIILDDLNNLKRIIK